MIQSVVFKISGMHCSSCAINIDGALEDTDGVVEAKTSYAKGQVEVRFDEGKLNPEKIKEIISGTGYEVI